LVNVPIIHSISIWGCRRSVTVYQITRFRAKPMLFHVEQHFRELQNGITIGCHEEGASYSAIAETTGFEAKIMKA